MEALDHGNMCACNFPVLKFLNFNIVFEANIVIYWETVSNLKIRPATVRVNQMSAFIALLYIETLILYH